MSHTDATNVYYVAASVGSAPGVVSLWTGEMFSKERYTSWRQIRGAMEVIAEQLNVEPEKVSVTFYALLRVEP